MYTDSVNRVEDRILRYPEVVKLTGLSKSTLQRLEKSGRFPARVRLSLRAVGFQSSLVQKFIETAEVKQ